LEGASGLHIAAIKDLGEYHHTHKKALVRQCEIGVDIPDSAQALRLLLRQDPTASAFRTALCGWNGGVSAGIELFANATQRV
jgi:hypothetical protein